MNDLYEALIESVTPVVRSAPEGVEALATHARHAARRRARRSSAPGCIRRRPSATSSTSDTPRYEAIRRHDARAGLAHADRRAARARRDAGPRHRDRRLQPHARPSAAAAGAGGALALLARSGLGLRQRPLDRVPRVPALDDPAHVRELGALRRRDPLVRGRRRPARLLVPVVGPAPEPQARHDRGARDGRAEPAGDGRRARGAGPRARRRLRRRRGGARAAAGGADGVLLPRRPRRDRRDASGGAARCARSARSARTRSRWRAPTRATSTARTRSRRSSASCARAAARTACARPTPPAGWSGYCAMLADETYGSTQTTSPIRSQS